MPTSKHILELIESKFITESTTLIKQTKTITDYLQEIMTKVIYYLSVVAGVDGEVLEAKP